MSPYDESWMLDDVRALELLSLEIAINDPRTVSVASTLTQCLQYADVVRRGLPIDPDAELAWTEAARRVLGRRPSHKIRVKR